MLVLLSYYFLLYRCLDDELKMCIRTRVTGYVALLSRQVICEEFSRCYGDVNICLWTDGLTRTHSEAQSYCQQRITFLTRVNSNAVQSKLGDFRTGAGNLLGGNGFWIDITASSIGEFHWIDGSRLGWFHLWACVHKKITASGEGDFCC